MKILLTNDDGYESPLLRVLSSYIKQHMPQCTLIVIVPQENKSAVSHSISIRGELEYRKIDKDVYIVDGTPVDCVFLGSSVLGRADVILSGPNMGANLGQDIMYSGTVAAVREGAIRNIPSMAISIFDKNNQEFFDCFDKTQLIPFLHKWLESLIKLSEIKRGSIVNVNVSMPVSLELREGKFSRRYYHEYSEVKKLGKDSFMALQKLGIDSQKEPEKGSDWELILQGKSTFTVFDVWPKRYDNNEELLYSFLKKR